MSRNLILYYSRRGENYCAGTIRSLEKGNTELAAEYIQRAVGGDLFAIETVEPYPADYYACTEQAKTELNHGARPALKASVESLDAYDNVFVCGPCWWGTYPCAVFTQLEKLDWRGKKVLPLMTHEGSGMGSSERDLKKACIGATFGKGLAVRGTDCKNAEAAVSAWAKKSI